MSMTIRPLAATALLALSLAACSKPSESAAPAALPLAPGAVRVIADGKGFTPSSVTLAKDKPGKLSFLRTTDDTCATAVVFPEIGVKKELPVNVAVDVDVPTAQARTLTFQCGMAMYKSAVVIQ